MNRLLYKCDIKSLLFLNLSELDVYMSRRILGLDIGVASVGWALIEENKRIIDLGVRTFKKAETDKTGEPLNLIRRESRLSRRRIFRRAQRLKKLLSFFISENLISNSSEILLNQNNENPWQLRNDALTKLLNQNQLCRILYHICKHRGFYWTSSAEASGDAENGKIKKSLSANEKLMLEKNYLTVGQMIFKEHPDCQRNKGGDYSKSLPRTSLAEEITTIFTCQERLGSKIIFSKLKDAILGNGDRKTGFLWQQKPALQGEQLLNMVGKCRFEKSELRAPVANFLAERHVWLTKLLNLRVIDTNGQSRALLKEEFDTVFPLAYDLKSEIKYKNVASSLIKAGFWKKDEFTFSGLKYLVKEGKKTDPENKVLCKMSAWQGLRKAFESANLVKEWNEISQKALLGESYSRLDTLTYALTVFKEDESLIKYLKENGESEDVINAVISLRFKEFSSLSNKALSKIVPFMEKGQRYDEACASAGYKHYLQSQSDKEKLKYLPSLFSGRTKEGTLVFNENIDDIPRNPVVIRAVNQTRKVINAVIKKYGSPSSVHIELARDIAKPFSERMEIKKRQEDNKSLKDKLRAEFSEIFGASELNGRNLEKYRLYKEQDSKSIYSGKSLDLHRLLEEGYVEVDHALPYSRSFDDSQNNKVLVLTKENRDKGNKTPYEYFMSEQADWHEFVERVNSCKHIYKDKKNRLLKQNFLGDSQKEFKERNLNDTRYICKFVKNYIDTYLQLADDATDARCITVNGALTSLLRAHWGLIKVREENDRHHALDAIVIACCSRSIVQKVARYSKQHELACVAPNFVDPDNDDNLLNEHHQLKFPYPWDNFRTEAVLRLNEDNKTQLENGLKILGTYSQRDLDDVKPLFVSRACQKLGLGALHKDTIRRQTPEMAEKEEAVTKIPLQNLNESNFSKLVDPLRNKNLYDALRKRLDSPKYLGKKGKWDAKKAFSSDNPMRMPDKNGIEFGPIVKTVRIRETKTGVKVRGGIAENGRIIRLDVFKKEGKFHLMPIYAWHLNKHSLPKKLATIGKTEENWTLLDESFEWCFSLRRNTLVKLVTRDGVCYFGYYAGFNRNTVSIAILLHDRSSSRKIGDKISKEGVFSSIGVKNAKIFEKYDVDVLGNYYKAQPEDRNDLA